MSLLQAAVRLRDALRDYPERAPTGTISYILNPLDYAWDNYATYLERFAPPGHTVDAVLLGMNPGPFGMVQTGVPFGTPPMVRDFLQIRGPVHPPARFHPKRPIGGIDATRSEISGERVWGAVRDCFGTPEPFFKRFFIANYCPLAFQTETGANVTPDHLPRALWDDCSRHCTEHLIAVLHTLKPRTVIGFGRWAELQARRVVEHEKLEVQVGGLLHPSPASPAANRGWRDQARAQLEALGHPRPEPTPLSR